LTTALTTTPPATALAELLLVRMALPNPTPSKVRADLGKLLETDLPAAEFDQIRDDLTAAGFLAKGKRKTFTLTDAGRERAFQFLGVTALPPRMNWSAVIARCLFPKAAELSADAAAQLNNGDKLAALVLKRKYGLSAGAGATVSQVAEAIVCKELGFPEEKSLAGLMGAVLNRLLGGGRLTREQIVKQLPLFETGLTAVSADAARRKVVRDWLTAGPVLAPPAAEAFDLPAFAGTVRALAAASPPADRFHDNKVFIGALWRASQQEPGFPRLALAAFKQRLIEANTQHLLHLSRADLVQAMDPQLVAESEAVHQNATYHFVLLEGDRP